MIIDGCANISAIAFARQVGLIGLIGLIQLLEGRACAVQHRFPTGGIAPGVEMGRINPGAFIVMKRVVDAFSVQPVAGLLHRVAILDAVNRNRHIISLFMLFPMNSKIATAFNIQ